MREVLEVVAGEDFRLNGCVCKPMAPCYLHAKSIPQALEALAVLEGRLEVERHAGEELADQVTSQAQEIERLEGRLAEATEALRWQDEDIATLREIVGRIIDAGVEKWHNIENDEPVLHSWLGLFTEEYAAWVELRYPFAPREALRVEPAPRDERQEINAGDDSESRRSGGEA